MGRKKPLRQFQCESEECNGRTWFERAARSVCRECEQDGRPVPRGEEIGVFACKFLCKCGNEYTVICRMKDEAKCYACPEHPYVAPNGFWPRGYINKKEDSTYVHNCSRCKGKSNCPNLAAVRHVPRDSRKQQNMYLCMLSMM